MNKTFRSILNEKKTNYKKLLRYIPADAKIKTDLLEKSLKVTIVESFSTSGLTMADFPSMEKRIFDYIKTLIKDIKTEIKIKEVKIHPHIRIEGKNGGITTYTEFNLFVSNELEGKKLSSLENVMLSRMGF